MTPAQKQEAARLDLYVEVLPRLLGTLSAMRERALAAAARQGVTPEGWAAMPGEEREALLARDRRQQRRRR